VNTSIYAYNASEAGVAFGSSQWLKGMGTALGSGLISGAVGGLTGGLLGPVLSGALGGFGGAVATGAIGGALGSGAGYLGTIGIMQATGQPGAGFSWGNFFAAAGSGAALGGAMGGAAYGFSKGFDSLKGLLDDGVGGNAEIASQGQAAGQAANNASKSVGAAVAGADDVAAAAQEALSAGQAASPRSSLPPALKETTPTSAVKSTPISAPGPKATHAPTVPQRGEFVPDEVSIPKERLGYADSPSRSGAARQALGTVRERAVARITGGKVSGEIITHPRLGHTDIDVIAGNGDLVMVGGGAKASNLGNLGRVIQLYQAEAAARGVGVQAYFAAGTPERVLEFTAQRIGPQNVVSMLE
jgi:hypothetical protein